MFRRRVHVKYYRRRPAASIRRARTPAAEAADPRADNRFFIVATGSDVFLYVLYVCLCVYIIYTLCTHYTSQLPGTPIPIDTHLKTLYRIIRRDCVSVRVSYNIGL